LLQRKKVPKNAAASEKIAKNQFIPLKENNSPRRNRGSDRFSFLTLHELIFFTHFFKGGSYVSNANCNSKHSPCVQASLPPLAGRKLSCPTLVSEGRCDKDSLIFSPGVTFFVTFLCGRQKSKGKK